MRSLLLASAALLVATPSWAVPPREKSPASQAILSRIGSGNSDAALESAIAAASAHPLGTLENPVRVGGPDGERAYLARLRCADGRAPAVAAKTAGGVGAFGSIVDRVSLDCGAAAPGASDLILDIYHAEHQEDRAPTGFTIAR